MTDRDRLHALISAVRYHVKHNVPGDFVECGVWRGGSMHAAARTLTECGNQSRELYPFDTVEGMPPPSDKDVRQDDQTAEHLLATKGKDQYIWAIAALDDVQQGFENVPYPKERVHATGSSPAAC